jgi:hypothetical protein
MVGLLMGFLQDLEREGTSSAGGAGKAILQQLSIYELVLRGWGGGRQDEMEDLRGARHVESLSFEAGRMNQRGGGKAC